eukprot:24701-Eustigmatos_ZCMA.PRE.1
MVIWLLHGASAGLTPETACTSVLRSCVAARPDCLEYLQVTYMSSASLVQCKGFSLAPWLPE